ncbi:hypothetical protein GCM10009759_55340 [Kitasatospora saccharophila]|uniref:Uncharacterized protein n=1 Tax=Kitasatospora saccharophila TaxID=407973 RepID=A0ABN2XL73_9ACTN
MARWTRTETTLRRVTHAVPTPAHHADLHAALDAAAGRWFRDHGRSVGEDFPDDALTITVTDGAVLISYDITDTEAAE